MDWFEKLTGFREMSYDDTRAKLKVEGSQLRTTPSCNEFTCESEPHGGNVAHSFRLRQHKRNSAGCTATGCGLPCHQQNGRTSTGFPWWGESGIPSEPALSIMRPRPAASRLRSTRRA